MSTQTPNGYQVITCYAIRTLTRWKRTVFGCVQQMQEVEMLESCFFVQCDPAKSEQLAVCMFISS